MYKKTTKTWTCAFLVLILLVSVCGVCKNCLKADFWKLDLANILEIAMTFYVGSVVARSLAHINAAYSKHVELLCQAFEQFECLSRSYVYRTELLQRETSQKTPRDLSFWLIAQKDFSRFRITLKSITEKYPEINDIYNKLDSYSETLYECGSSVTDSNKSKDEQEIALNQMNTTLEQICEFLFEAKADIFNKDFKR